MGKARARTHAEIHDKAIVDDGLICAKWIAEVYLKTCRKGKLTARELYGSRFWGNFEGHGTKRLG